MVVTIIDGNELSYVLARILLQFRHTVNVIVHKGDPCVARLESLGAHVIEGEGTDMAILSLPCVADSDIVISLMDRDDDNLASCLYLKKNGSPARLTVTKVTNPRYASIFEHLGVDIAFDCDSLVAGLLGRGNPV